MGLGAAALGHLLAESGYAASDPLAQLPHFAPKAKHVIFLFMAGAPSHLELFDNKPQLAKFDGTLPPAELLKAIAPHSSIPIRSCWVPSSSSAATARAARNCASCCHSPARSSDEIAIVKSMVTDAFNHAPGQLLMNTGTMQFGRPSMGAWVLYGLGRRPKICRASWCSVPAARAERRR